MAKKQRFGLLARGALVRVDLPRPRRESWIIVLVALVLASLVCWRLIA